MNCWNIKIKTAKHLLTQIHSAAPPCNTLYKVPCKKATCARRPLRCSNRGNKHRFSPHLQHLTLTLDANRCVSQSHRIQSIKRRISSRSVSDTEQQWAVHTTPYLQFFSLSCLMSTPAESIPHATLFTWTQPFYASPFLQYSSNFLPPVCYRWMTETPDL